LADEPCEIKGTPLVALGVIPAIVEPVAYTPIWYCAGEPLVLRLPPPPHPAAMGLSNWN
jgi:hypothetical protein